MSSPFGNIFFCIMPRMALNDYLEIRIGSIWCDSNVCLRSAVPDLRIICALEIRSP